MTKTLNWIPLREARQLEDLVKESASTPVLIFKHSTRCSISSAVLNRLERNWKPEEMAGVQPYFLDLLSYRQLSNQIAESLHVEHQSPQALVVSHGQVVLADSHYDISVERIREAASTKN